MPISSGTRAMLLVLGAAFLAGAHSAAAQGPPRAAALVATGWEVFPDAESRRTGSKSKPDTWAGLLAEDVLRAGWTVEPPRNPGGVRGTVDGTGPYQANLSLPSLIVVDRPATPWTRVVIDGMFDFVPVVDHRGRTVAAVPEGVRRIEIAEPDRLRNMAVWWGSAFLPALLAALAAWLAARALSPGRPSGIAAPPPLRLRPVLLLAAGIAVPWAWLLFAPPVANDYGWTELTREQTFGVKPPWFDRESIPPALLFTADSPIFRIVHHTVYALELAPFGPSGVWLHFWAIVYQAANGVLLYAILRRWFPKGAFAGALAGATWPVAGQALAWNAARCLPMAHTMGMLALLCALRFFERGGRCSLATAAACVWLAAGMKETGLAYGAVVGGLPLLLHLGSLSWRRIVPLWAGLASVAACYIAVRHLLGYGFPKGYHGVVFKSSLETVSEGARNLVHAVQGGLHFTHHRPDSEPVEFLGGTMDRLAMLPFGCAAALLLLILVRRSWRGLLAVLLGAAAAALLALPDAVWLSSSRSLVTGRFYYIVPLVMWAVLLAAAIQACAGVRWMSRTASGIAVALLILAGAGHYDEGRFRVRMARVGEEWIAGIGRKLDELEEKPVALALRGGHELSGPPASVVAGFPDRPGKGESPLLGVTVTGYVQPPYTRRPRHGDTFSNAEDAGAFVNRPFAIPGFGRTLDAYPWPVFVFVSPGGQEVPVHRSTLPALGPPLPERRRLAVVAAAGGAFRCAMPLSGRPLRAVGGLGIAASGELPGGTRVRWFAACEGGEHGIGETTLRVPHLAGGRLWLPVRSIPGTPLLPRAEAIVFEVQLPGRPGAPGPGPELEAILAAELPSVELIEPCAGDVVARGASFPRLRFRGTEHAPMYRVRIAGHGSRAPRAMDSEYLIPERLIPPDGAGVRTLDILSHFEIGADAWNDSIRQLAENQPAIDGFTIWIEIEGVSGDPGYVQSRSVAAPVKIAF